MKKIIEILGTKMNKKIKSEIFVKLSEPERVNESKDDQKEKLLQKLQDKDSWFIYFAYEDVFCQVGFEYTPLKPLDAFMPL